MARRKNHFKRVRYVNVAAYLFILYAFSLPFLTVSCTDHVRLEYTGYDCVLGKNFDISAVDEIRPIVYFLVPFLLLLAATLTSIFSPRPFLKFAISFNIAAILIFLAIIIFTVVKKVKLFFGAKVSWSIIKIKDRFDITLNHGFWIVLMSILLLTIYDVRQTRRKRV